MEGTERTILYAIAAACILGMIIIVGVLELTSHATEEGFSELYFKNPDMLPRVIKMGDKINFAFTTASHEKKQTAYNYRVTYDGQDIRSGSFSLEPSSSKTINVSLTPKNSSSVKKTDLDLVLKQSKMKMDVNMTGNLLLPIRLQNTDINGTLIFDPKRKEPYNTSLSDVVVRVGQVPSDGQLSISNHGYSMRRDDWNIVNDEGNIEIMQKSSNSIYRYAFNNVSVEVSSTGSEMRGAEKSDNPAVSDTRNGSEYEIHFWIVVEEDPDKLQKIW